MRLPACVLAVLSAFTCIDTMATEAKRYSAPDLRQGTVTTPTLGYSRSASAVSAGRSLRPPTTWRWNGPTNRHGRSRVLNSWCRSKGVSRCGPGWRGTVCS